VTYQRFEELPVWKSAIVLLDGVYELCDAAEDRFRRRVGLRSQLERTALSVSNDISEGFERGTKEELLTFLYIARGSAGEVRSMLGYLSDASMFSDFKSQISNLKSQSESCSRQLRAWAQSLQDSRIKGQRHLSKSARQEYALQQERERIERDREEFLKEVSEQVRQSRGF
jgi:four helix bundle protein